MSASHKTPVGATRLGIAGIVVVGFSIAYQLMGWTFLAPPDGGSVPDTIGTYYKVIKVTDGDTIHVDMDGTNETVRFLGINTPETVDPRTTVQCFGREASARMKELAGGKLVRLEYDDSQSMRDKYGRLLAYVYLEDGEMLNRKMIADGYAYEYTYMLPYKYQAEFRDLQNLARTSGRGLWAADTCNGQKTAQ